MREVNLATKFTRRNRNSVHIDIDRIHVHVGHKVVQGSLISNNTGELGRECIERAQAEVVKESSVSASSTSMEVNSCDLRLSREDLQAVEHSTNEITIHNRVHVNLAISSGGHGRNFILRGQVEADSDLGGHYLSAKLAKGILGSVDFAVNTTSKQQLHHFLGNNKGSVQILHRCHTSNREGYIIQSDITVDTSITRLEAHSSDSRSSTTSRELEKHSGIHNVRHDSTSTSRCSRGGGSQTLLNHNIGTNEHGRGNSSSGSGGCSSGRRSSISRSLSRRRSNLALVTLVHTCIGVNVHRVSHRDSMVLDVKSGVMITIVVHSTERKFPIILPSRGAGTITLHLSTELAQRGGDSNTLRATWNIVTNVFSANINFKVIVTPAITKGVNQQDIIHTGLLVVYNKALS
mmetsp:Transcript_11030/g.18004  ORF Transcript_11030/g.18004 Transcript_11030/m.18004 type:complete len:405 (-) Transcript_11030:1257-2471(-)